MKACPITGTKGKPVDSATLKALSSQSLRALTKQQYYFCEDTGCDVVYFSEDQSHQITVDQVRVRVYQKEPDNRTVPICYCFSHTVADVLDDPDSVIDDINQGIKDDQCACDWRNPQGTCCLGNVRSLAKKSRGM